MRVIIKTNIDELIIPSRLLYTIDFINNHPYLPENTTFEINSTSQGKVDVEYSYDSSYEVILKVCKLGYVFSSNKINPDKLELISYTFKKHTYYGITNSGCNESSHDGNYIFDVFESIFFFISRIEELDFNPEDPHFDKHLFSIKNAINEIPVVDDLVELLLLKLNIKPIKKEWKHKITHDVDFYQKFNSPYAFLKSLGGELFIRKRLKHFKKNLIQYNNKLKTGNDPFNTFDWLLTDKVCEKEIYFLVGGSHTFDNSINRNDKNIIKKIAKKAVNHSYKIGVHPSFKSWDNPEMILNEKNLLERLLNKEIIYSRQHYLNFHVGITPELLLKAGIKYDSSLGFTRHIGFRCGTGFDYPLYDFKNESVSNLIESPLFFMDSACWHFCNNNIHEYREKLFSTINEYQGYRLVYNFHNSFIDNFLPDEITLIKKNYLGIFN